MGNWGRRLHAKTEQLHPAFEKISRFFRPRHFDQMANFLRHRLTWINEQINANGFAHRDQRRIPKIEIVDTRNAGRHLILSRQRTGDEIDLIGVRHGNDHVGLCNPGTLQRRRVRTMAVIGQHIQLFPDASGA